MFQCRRLFVAAALCAVAGSLVSSCSEPEIPRPSLKEAPTHARYAAALSEFGLDNVALGQDWLTAADLALTSPMESTAPFAETGHLTAERPTAVGYRLELVRGRKLAVDVSYATPKPGRLFIDLLELREGREPNRVGGAEPGEFSFEFDVRRTGVYVLRLQPELLRGGQYSIVQRTLASFIFPLKDRSIRQVASGFGAPRDGGARDHHGIDIFAPRGTPVIAIADGRVTVDDTPRGGRVIWLREARMGRNLYYAHLNDWAVASGDTVQIGDVIGFVGNTGNARTTPPHLHFGVYDRGPTDPVPYLYRDDPAPRAVTASLDPLGDWMRVVTPSASLRPVFADAGSAAVPVPVDAEVRVMAARRDDYRVRLSDGTVGLLRPSDLAPRIQ